MTTNKVPKPVELEFASKVVQHYLGTPKNQPWVGLPQSKSYLKIVQAPAFRNPSLPPTPANSTTMEDVLKAMSDSPMRQIFDEKLAGPPRVARVANKSSEATIYFEIWDSQTGFTASKLINKKIPILHRVGIIVGASAERGAGAPFCDRCCRFGHTNQGCRAVAPVCPRCTGPHTGPEHRMFAGCCKGADPTVTTCPHRHLDRCVNCGGPHAATDRRCIFWKNVHDRRKIEEMYREVREQKALHRSRTKHTQSDLAP